MALIACKECKKEVSSKAEKCPHCGVRMKRETAGCGTLIAFIIFVIVMANVWNSFTTKPAPQTVNQPKEPEPFDAYRTVSATCPPIIQELSKYDYKWTDTTFNLRFKSGGSKTADPNIVTYFGDRLQMQNGLGAWMNVIYYCDINLATGKIVDVRVEHGRL